MRPTDNGRGVGIGMMQTKLPCKILVGLVVMAAAACEVRAQNITPLVTKKTLSSNETAEIEVWITKKVQALSRANTDVDVNKVETQVLDVVTKQQPSPVFATEFATKCGDNLGPVTGQAVGQQIDLLRALGAVRIMKGLDHPGTANGLAEALRSPAPSVRFLAAKSVQAIHSKLTDETALENVLNALGEAIATESGNYVLPELYAALDFKSGNSGFKAASGNLMAGAAAKGFAGRANRLSEGARDEAVDMAGLNTALSVAGDANATNRKQLAVATAGLMAQATERHLDAQTNDTQKETLRQLIAKQEELISRLVNAKGDGSPPTEKVSQLLNGANPNPKAVRDALAKWQAAAAGL